MCVHVILHKPPAQFLPNIMSFSHSVSIFRQCSKVDFDFASFLFPSVKFVFRIYQNISVVVHRAYKKWLCLTMAKHDYTMLSQLHHYYSQFFFLSLLSALSIFSWMTTKPCNLLFCMKENTVVYSVRVQSSRE